MKFKLWLAVASTCVWAGAETVTIGAAAGKAKTDYAVRSGDTALVVNEAATAGTVRLSPYNLHTGGTTLKGGTFDVRTAADGTNPADTGTGALTLTGGNFRYAGAPDAVWRTPIENAAAGTDAVNWQIDENLVVDAPVTSPSGVFVKTGPGTLTLKQNVTLSTAGAVADSTVRKQMADLSPDHAPTKGISNATILDGTLVIDSPQGDVASAAVTNVLTTAGYLQVGGYTTVDGQEKSAVLEQRGGVTRTGGSINIGSNNGKVGQTGEPPVSGIRLTGGRFLVGAKGGSPVYMGAKTAGAANNGGRSFLEITSTNQFVCQGFYACENAGSVCDVTLRDGGYLFAQHNHYFTGNASSSPASTNNILVTGKGSWMSIRHLKNDVKNGGLTTNLRVADGGVLEMWEFENSEKGKLNLVFDGGVWRHRWSDRTNIAWPSSLTSVKVGPGGLSVYHNGGGGERYPVIWDTGIEPIDDSGTDGGLRITDSGTTPQLLIRAVNTYCGPTYIQKIRVELGGAGRLPETTALTICSNYGGLLVSNGVQTVASLDFGFADRREAASPLLGFTKGSRLDVTGPVRAHALNTPKLALFEEAGPTNAAVNGLLARGTYTFVTAPAASRAALAQMAARFTFPYKPTAVDYAAYVTVVGDRAELRVEVTDAGTAAGAGSSLVLATTGGASRTATEEELTAAQQILTNPTTTGGGVVELGALTGFAPGGGVLAGSGRTRLSDLSYLQAANGLVVGAGSLVYTGASATIPGFTLDTGDKRYSGVFDVADAATELTVQSFDWLCGGFSKMGAGTLRLGGAGAVTAPGHWRDNGTSNGMTPTGDGPYTGFRDMNVNGGVLAIGVKDDPANAPTLQGLHEFSVGSQSHRDGSDVQTTGELVMDNGALLVDNVFYFGYYCGADTVFTGTLHPTVTQNGGLIRAGSVRMFHTYDSDVDAHGRVCPHLALHGGVMEIGTSVAIGCAKAIDGFTGRAEVTVDGGLLKVGTDVLCGHDNGTLGVDFTISGAGRVEANGNFNVNKANAGQRNVLRLIDGGTLKCRSIMGGGATKPSRVVFDGGVFMPVVLPTQNSDAGGLDEVHLGAKGLVVDLSHQFDLGETIYWSVIPHKFQTDPDLGDAPDGGITFTGAGTVATWSKFEESSFKGGIRIEKGARFVVTGSYFPKAIPLTVRDGGRLSDYKSSNVNAVGDLTLGEAGAEEPVYLEAMNNDSVCGIVVTGTLNVLSPVAFAVRTDNHNFTPVWPEGVYTALVYNASNADVDLSKFVLPPEVSGVTLSVRQETLGADAGTYAGYKAVIATIDRAAVAGNAPVWTSVTTGGTWSDTANWQDVATAPNGATAAAKFNPATKASVPVNLAAPVTLRELALTAGNAKYGYTLSGEGLTLASNARVENQSGTSAVSSELSVPAAAQVRAAKGSELRLANVIGAGELQLNDKSADTEGQVTAHVSPDYAGRIVTGAGKVSMDDLSFVKAADQLTLGPGTLLYTGDDVAIAGLQLGAGDKKAVVFDTAADVTVNSLTAVGPSALLKRGTGTLRVHGTSTFSPNTCVNNSSGNTPQSNGDSPLSGFRGLGVATGLMVWGEKDNPENAPIFKDTLTKELTVGAVSSQGNATLDLNNGSISLNSVFYLGYYGAKNNTYTFKMNGGSFKANHIYCAYLWSGVQRMNTAIEVNGGTGSVSKDVYLGRNYADKPAEQFCRWTQNGGLFQVNGDFHTCYSIEGQSPQGIVDLNGGVLSVTGAVMFARSGPDTEKNVVRFSLNLGGRLEVNAITQEVAAAENTCFYGNGGTLCPIGVTAAGGCFGGVGKLYASTNGLVVDTTVLAEKGKDYLIGLPILHDPEAPAIDGGVVKQGAGLLRLTGANAFTGPLTPAGGTVRLEGAACAPIRTLVFAGGVLDTVAPLTTDTLRGAGRCLGSLSVTGTLVPEADNVVSVFGDFTLAAGAKVDFSRYPAGSLNYGDSIPLATTTGTAMVPSALSIAAGSEVAHVSGHKFRLSVSVDADGVVWGTVSSSGTLLLFR